MKDDYKYFKNKKYDMTQFDKVFAALNFEKP